MRMTNWVLLIVLPFPSVVTTNYRFGEVREKRIFYVQLPLRSRYKVLVPQESVVTAGASGSLLGSYCASARELAAVHCEMVV